MEAMDEDRTASSSRRSAKLRDRSRGSESRVWVYSDKRDNACTVEKFPFVEEELIEARAGAMDEFSVWVALNMGGRTDAVLWLFCRGQKKNPLFDFRGTLLRPVDPDHS